MRCRPKRFVLLLLAALTSLTAFVILLGYPSVIRRKGVRQFVERESTPSAFGEWNFVPLLSEISSTVFQPNGWMSPRALQSHLAVCRRRYNSKRMEASVSFIITFYQRENCSNVVRAVRSIVERTPAKFVHQFVLVNDCATAEALVYILPAVLGALVGRRRLRIVRSSRCLGLIKARQAGVDAATGEVVVWMDSHVEVQPFWLEPLLAELKLNGKTLATSYLDWFDRIDTQNGTFHYNYRYGARDWITYVDLSMTFGFQDLNIRSRATRESTAEAISSPMTIGTLVAITREWFYELGGFDVGMELWGGENIDLSLRSWLFGGRVVNVPCSSVAHLEASGYREGRASWGKTIRLNYKRLAEVWMPEHKHYLYQIFPELLNASIGSLHDRMSLREKAVHDFDWFLTNIQPELQLPDKGLAFGKLRNIRSQLCAKAVPNGDVQLSLCQDGGEVLFWSRDRSIRLSMYVLIVQGDSIIVLGAATFFGGNRTTTWEHMRGGQIIEDESRRCVDVGTSPGRDSQLILANCDNGKPSQNWQFYNYTRDYELQLPQR